MINLFKFIEKKKGYNIPFMFKLIHNIPLNKEELYVNGSLDLRNTKIKELPDNLTIQGHLDLYDTKIIKLPNNLEVRGHLDLIHTEITKLPNNLKVGRTLDIRGTEITELPDDLEVHGRIFVTHGKEEYFKDNFPKFANKIT